MKVEFLESFDKDLQKVGDAILARQVRKLILRLENATTLSSIPNVKKLAGGDCYYRIRLGDFRVGFILKGTTLTLVRVLHRKEIYRYFP